MGQKKKYCPEFSQVNISFAKIVNPRYIGIIREAVQM
jgi:hypothetical protein